MQERKKKKTTNAVEFEGETTPHNQKASCSRLGPKETAWSEKPKLTCLHSLQNITFQ